MKDFIKNLKIKVANNKCFQKVAYFLNKENFIKTKLILVAVLSVIAAIVFEYTIYRRIDPQYISKNRMMLVSAIFMFIGIHFVFKLDKMYGFIHKYRYHLAGAFLVFVMVMGYHGSSIVNFDEQFQMNSDNRRFHTLLGVPRLIRTDEWASSMLYRLSQGVGDNKFEYFNDNLRGTKTDMFTLVDAPVKDILMIGKPLQLGFLFFGNDAGISFYWYGKLVCMLLGSYEICRIITKDKRKISLVGTLAITFSAAVQWWYCMDTLIWGQIILVLVNKFMITDKKYVKYLCALGLVSSMLAYVFVLYPAWQVSFAYVFLALLIWMLITNIKDSGYRFTLHDVIVIIATVLIVVAFLCSWYMKSKDAIEATMNTDYPGARMEVGGGALILYSYFYNIFWPFKYTPNPCETSSMLSFYPIPMILGLIYLIRNRKNWSFLVPTLLTSVFLLIWCKYGFNEFLAKATLMSMTTSQRATIALGTLNIYILIYLFGKMEDGVKLLDINLPNKENKEKLKKISKILTYVVLAVFSIVGVIYIGSVAKKQLIMLLPQIEGYLGNAKRLIASVIFAITIFSILNMNKKCFKNIALYMIIFIALLSGLLVNPVSRSTDIIYEKPISKKIAEIREKDPDALWLGDDTGWYLNNYMVANGVSVINSTNVYPNLKLFEDILGDKAQERKSEYNRYCHVNINLGKYDENTVTAVAPDNVLIEMNYTDLQKLGIDYVVAKKDLNETYDMEFEELYAEDGLYIFKPIYK